jgi:hypothetical protein
MFEFHPVHPSFLAFLQDICDTVETDLPMTDMYTWDGKGLRIHQFGSASDLNWYASDGSRCLQVPVQSGQPFISSCLLQIKGIWKTSNSWGLKILIKEIQVHPDSHPQYHDENAWAFRDDNNDIQDFMFLLHESY